jgi:hypothetical protein
MRSAARGIGIGIALAAAVGCGGAEEAPPPSAAFGGPTAKAATQPPPEGANRPPRIESVRIEPRNPAPGQRLHAVVVAHDPDGDAVSLSYAWRLRGSSVPGDGPEMSTNGLERGQSAEVSVSATDGRGGASPLATASAELGNQAPVVHAIVLEPLGELTALHDVVARPQASDADGDQVEFQFEWRVNGKPAPTQGDVLPRTAFKRGDEITVQVVPSDGRDEGEPLRGQPIRVANAAPEIVSQPPAPSGEEFVYQLVAKDPDGDTRLRYALANAPGGMQVDPVLGQVRWKPSPDDAGTYDIEAIVSDPQGASSKQRFRVIVGEVKEEAPPAAQAPAAGGAGRP